MANEKRLIDANAVLRKINKRREEFADCWKTYGAMPEIAKAVHGENLECALMVDDAPTVDAVEVVHGRWEDDHCTNCNTEFTVNINGEDVKITEIKSNYCPNCGAKMDGDTE